MIVSQTNQIFKNTSHIFRIVKNKFKFIHITEMLQLVGGDISCVSWILTLQIKLSWKIKILWNKMVLLYSTIWDNYKAFLDDYYYFTKRFSG